MAAVVVHPEAARPGARGGKPWCFEKLEWTGKTPFEVHERRAKPDGFELTFTEPVDAKAAGNPASYSMRAFTYAYREDYGGPEVDEVLPAITAALGAVQAGSQESTA